jgi:hypothetical protein
MPGDVQHHIFVWRALQGCDDDVSREGRSAGRRAAEHTKGNRRIVIAASRLPPNGFHLAGNVIDESGRGGGRVVPTGAR